MGGSFAVGLGAFLEVKNEKRKKDGCVEKWFMTVGGSKVETDGTALWPWGPVVLENYGNCHWVNKLKT